MRDVRTEERFPVGPLADEWETLLDLDPAGTVFQNARFLRLWCQHLRGRCDLRIRFVNEGSDVIGVVPEVRETDTDTGWRIVHFAGGEHVTDYLGPVSRPEHRPVVAEAWIEALAAEEDWDEVRAGGLAEDAGWHEHVAGAADRAGLDVAGPEVEDVCPRIDLAGGWDGYLERLSSKQRHEIRRKARKLGREAAVVKLDEVDRVDAVEEVETFIALHRRSPGDKATFFDRPGTPDFFRGLAAEFAADGTLRVHRLDVDGQLAAMTLSLVRGGDRSPREWGLYNSAFEPDLGPLAPGLVLVGELIRIAAEEGCDVFDLLRGAEPYKYRFGAEDRRLRELTITRGRS